MKSSLTNPLIATAFFGLAACGGGGGDGGGGGGGGTADNGLPFAAAGQDLNDAEGVEVSGQAASFQVGEAPTTETLTITLDAGFFAAVDDTDRSLTIELFGETIEITDGEATLLPNGEEVRVIYEDDRSGEYVAAVEITVSGPDIGDINGEGVYVIGFETDPATIAAATGTLEYEGGFQAAGSLNGASNTNAEFEGTMTVTVDFTGVGAAQVLLDGELNNDPGNAILSGTVPLSGNGFTGSVVCATGCTGSTGVDATFYGPDGEELAGVLAVDVNVGGDNFDGVGSFILTDPTAP